MRKSFIMFSVMGLIFITSTCSIADDSKTLLINKYNLTRQLYINTAAALGDFKDKIISAGTVQRKLREWKAEYNRKIKPLEEEARDMYYAMVDVIDLTEEIIDEYHPHHQKTKERLKKLEEFNSHLLRNMKKLLYVLK